MAIFTDNQPDPTPKRRRGRTIAWIVIVAAVVGVVAVSAIPAPYVIEQPGPVFNTLGKVAYKGGEQELIDIPGKKTYATAGTLDMLTVNVSGNREQPPSWFEIARAWVDPSEAVVPIDEIYPKGVSLKQSEQEDETDMTNSQQDAIAAALHELDYSFTSKLTVAQTIKGYPANGVLQAGDVIVSLNGKAFEDVDQLKDGIAANGTSKAATVVVERAGAQKTVQLTPVESGGAASTPIVGISVASTYAFPFDVKIQLENVGGPSAGMMFALGIIDKLTPGKLNGGQRVAGTGTISASGVVGPIGGIRQKMYGARGAGATWFLAPKSNCNEVVGHIPAGLTVYAVSKLSDSMTALKAIESGKGRSSLATCSSK